MCRLQSKNDLETWKEKRCGETGKKKIERYEKEKKKKIKVVDVFLAVE